MDYEIEERPKACILRIKQDLSATHDPELRRAFVNMSQNQANNVVADMREVSFMDSTVLGTFVWALKNTREAGGDLRMFGLKDFVQNLFEVTTLNKAFQIFDAESDAVASFGEVD